MLPWFDVIAESDEIIDLLSYTYESPLASPLGFLRNSLHDLLTSIDPAYRLFRRNLALRYRYSSLGIAWSVAPALIISLVMTVGQRAKLSALYGGTVPPQFYAVFGLFIALTFVEAMNTQRLIFSGISHQMMRSRAAIESLILAGAAENAFNLLVKLIVLAGVFLIFRVPLAPTWPFGLVGFGMILILGTAAGLLLAPFNALRDDIENIMMFFPWVFFAAAPVFVAARPHTVLATVYRLNPLSSLIDMTRTATYGSAGNAVFASCATYFTCGIIASTFVLFLTWALCRISKPYVVERYLV